MFDSLLVPVYADRRVAGIRRNAPNEKQSEKSVSPVGHAADSSEACGFFVGVVMVPEFITAHGKTQTWREWEKELGLRPRAIYTRIIRGMDPVRAVSVLMIEPRHKIVGRRYGMLVVQSVSDGAEKKKTAVVMCDCGVEKTVAVGNLKNLSTNSCGCNKRKVLAEKNTKHGVSVGCDGRSSLLPPEYKAWRHIRSRCGSPTNARWEYYGGRGITVCDRWKESFENFLADMGKRPSDTHSIDRIDVNGNYCPENCRWATKQEQACNMRTNVNITFRGETMTISQWAERTKMPYKTLHHRLKKATNEAEIEIALTKPIGPSGRRKNKSNGRSENVGENESPSGQA